MEMQSGDARWECEVEMQSGDAKWECQVRGAEPRRPRAAREAACPISTGEGRGVSTQYEGGKGGGRGAEPLTCEGGAGDELGDEGVHGAAACPISTG